MKPIDTQTAQANLSELNDRACAGEEIVIGDNATGLVRIVPVKTPMTSSVTGRQFGALRGRSRVLDSFFDPLPEDELKAWEGDDKT